MPEHRRRLPHVYPEGKELFVTWRLHGSLPPSRYPPSNQEMTAGEAFVWIDRCLDTTRTGPLFLKNERVAEIVVDSLFFGADELDHYGLLTWVVMPNHVHMLALPKVPPSRFMQSLKGFTAREANKVLNRTGQPFWQKESYDHWVRDADEGRRVRAYIENNPVRAGLAAAPELYRWSSAAWRDSPELPARDSSRGRTQRRRAAWKKGMSA